MRAVRDGLVGAAAASVVIVVIVMVAWAAVDAQSRDVVVRLSAEQAAAVASAVAEENAARRAAAEADGRAFVPITDDALVQLRLNEAIANDVARFAARTRVELDETLDALTPDERTQVETILDEARRRRQGAR
jgi:hypothetical protein